MSGAAGRITLAQVLLALLGVLAFATLATGVQIGLGGLSLADNGDGFRVLDKGFVPREAQTPGAPPGAAYPMMPLAEARIERAFPDNLSGLLMGAIALAAKAAGLSEVPVWPLTFLYHTLFAAGVGLLLRGLVHPAAKGAVLAAAAAFLATPGLVGMFHSFMEDAAAYAVFPLWLAALREAARREGAEPLAVVATCALLYAKPSTLLFVLPVLLLLALRPGRGRPWLAALLLVALAVGAARNQVRFGELNAFNRVYNGLAYASAEVSDWPVRHFVERNAMAKGLVADDHPLLDRLPEPARDLWGASFWPDGRDLPPDIREALAAEGRLTAYLGHLAAEPRLLADILRESWETAVAADYRLDYLSPGIRAWPGTPLLSGLGFVLPAAAVLLLLALARRAWIGAALMAPIVLSPAFVVAADGFYEYEKHLLIYLAPGALAAVATLDLALRRAAPALEREA